MKTFIEMFGSELLDEARGVPMKKGRTKTPIVGSSKRKAPTKAQQQIQTAQSPSAPSANVQNTPVIPQSNPIVSPVIKQPIAPKATVSKAPTKAQQQIQTAQSPSLSSDPFYKNTEPYMANDMLKKYQLFEQDMKNIFDVPSHTEDELIDKALWLFITRENNSIVN